MTEEQLIAFKANMDELAILANSEEVAAGLSNITEGTAELVNSVLGSVSDFLNSLGD